MGCAIGELHLLQEDAQLILALPIKDDTEDTWDWFPDHRGLFLVRTTYNAETLLMLLMGSKNLVMQNCFTGRRFVKPHARSRYNNSCGVLPITVYQFVTTPLVVEWMLRQYAMFATSWTRMLPICC